MSQWQSKSTVLNASVSSSPAPCSKATSSLSSGLHSPGYLQCALVLQHPAHAEALGRALGDELRDLGADGRAVAGARRADHRPRGRARARRARDLRRAAGRRADAAPRLLARAGRSRRRHRGRRHDGRIDARDDGRRAGAPARRSSARARSSIAAAAPSRLDVPFHALVTLDVADLPARGVPALRGGRAGRQAGVADLTEVRVRSSESSEVQTWLTPQRTLRTLRTSNLPLTLHAHAEADPRLRRHELRRLAAAGERRCPFSSWSRRRSRRWPDRRAADGGRARAGPTPACTRSAQVASVNARDRSCRRRRSSARSTSGCRPTSACSASWTRRRDFTRSFTRRARRTATGSRRRRSLSPFDRWFVWHAPGAARRRTRCAAAAAALVGRHDFASFQAARRVRARHGADDSRASTCARPPARSSIEVDGDGFLRHMVRAIVGTLAEVGRRAARSPRVDGGAHRRARDRRRRPGTRRRRPRGLTLVRSSY